MTSTTQVTHMGAPAAAPEEIVYRPTPGRRISLAGQAERTAQAVEGVRADFQAKIDRLERENAALRREAADMQARSVEAAVATGAALQAQATTIESQTTTIESQTTKITSLSEELDEAKTKFARLDVIVATYRPFCNWSPPLPQVILEYTLHGDKKWLG